MNGVRKVKKIRKSKKLSALDIIKNVEDGEMDTKRLRKETLEAKKNSKRKTSTFEKWKNKDIEKWTATDFFGWYLYNYKKYFNEEDVVYSNITSASSVKVEIYRIAYFLKTYFNGDKKQFKKYIQFGFKFATQPNSFYTSFGFWYLFNKKLFLFKVYKDYLKGKKVFKRSEMDNDFSTDEAWEEYYGGEIDED
ncbi:hypothetical protein [Thermosipho sp. (in: thermotogales)]|uniref:hypothetical protein n=1 Tax=Thermosipho sp. (in: thermotogales) TaxID=1968895 RepID=UPI0025798124|nr:hypothetical protein [Thermosipho sp. (in: thermotogales)]MBZ4649158.1 hypothetical protein [Thermosipho sp. (in: thermotogales)]